MFRVMVLTVLAAVIIRRNCEGMKSTDPEAKEMLRNLHKMCVDETGVEESLVIDAESGKFSNDKKLQCYLKCTAEQLGVVDNDKFDEESFRGMLPEDLVEIANKAADACINEKVMVGEDICEKVWNVNKCFQGIMGNQYVLVV